MPIYGNKKDYIGSAVSSSDNSIDSSFKLEMRDDGKYYLIQRYDSGSIRQIYSINGPADVAVHELGHLLARLPDYYEIDTSCGNHKCRMCDQKYLFTSKPLCVDKQRMVEQLNQFCDAQITSISNTYPNPWTPQGTDKKNPSWDGNVRINYKVSYPANSDPCYILMHVYNSIGQEVRVLVSDEPMKSNCGQIKYTTTNLPQQFNLDAEKHCEDYYTFVWDGKDNEGKKVASGVYIYKITGNPNFYQSIKGTIVK